MGQDSKIQWTDHTVNLWWGCVEVGPGCDHCYAKTLATRYGRDVWGNDKPRFFTKNWQATLRKAQKIGMETGVRQRVFIQSMSDIGEILPEGHPDAMQMAAARQALWDMWPSLTMVDGQFLTKRIGNMSKIVPASWMAGEWPENAWLGISVVDQKEADRDIIKLLRVPAPRRFLSLEPLLGPIDLQLLPLRAEGPELYTYAEYLSWVICGGESGPGARSLNLGWAKDLMEQCQGANVPFFMKQLGRSPVGRNGQLWKVTDSHGSNIADFPEILRVREFPE